MPIQKHKWKLLLLSYFIITFVSGLFISITDNEDQALQIVYPENSTPVFLLFDDPLARTELRNIHVLSVPQFDSAGRSSPESMSRNAGFILDSLGIESIHVIGRGSGGPSAVQFSVDQPDRVRSVQLISSNGIVELELLGGYHLNHAVYGAQLVFYKIAKFSIPHFGNWTKVNDRIKRFELLFNTDQRLFRKLASDLDQPVQVIHDESSKLKEGNSKELTRIIPQSEQLTVTGSNSLSRSLTDFAQRVEQGNAVSRTEAVQERISRSLEPFNTDNAVQAEGTALLFLMLLIIFSTFITEDLTCIGTGLMIARGLIGFYPGLAACLLGIFFGDIMLYVIGRSIASGTLHKAPLKWFITEADIEKSNQWFKAKGPAIIIAARFIPGTRFPTYFSAGVIGARFSMFLLYFGVSSLLWTPAIVGLSVLLGNQMMEYFNLYQEYALWVLFGVLVLLWVIFKILVPSLTFKGRRLLIGKWKRLVNWEFWPPYILYAPVMIYLTGLWLKYRSITLFAAANPGIEYGGFIKESKSEILSKFGDQTYIAKYLTVQPDSEDTLQEIRRFMNSEELSFPIVLKPDVGERGKGVAIIKNDRQLKNELKAREGLQIIQEYIDGEEFGIFYYRYPGDETGRIFSITVKEYLNLTGDGGHTVEELILKHERAVCLAEYHIDQHIGDLYHVPEKGKSYKLVQIGTHSRGSVFFDGEHLITPGLTRKLDSLSKDFDGFYIGRYDVKVPSKQKLKAGKGMTVIELNGVTSESTNIYDPGNGYFDAVRILCRQWKIAYQIAARVKKKKPDLILPSVKDLIGLLR